MSQNLIDLSITNEAFSVIDSALDAMENQLAPLRALTPDQRRQLTKMGDKSEAFCRQAVDVLGENPGILPANFDYPGFRRDLAMLDALRPRLIRLARLQERCDDSVMALGSDLMTNALEGYAFLKIAGKGEGLDSLRKMMSARFERNATKPPSAPAQET